MTDRQAKNPAASLKAASDHTNGFKLFKMHKQPNLLYFFLKMRIVSQVL
jgi:hypothetical protein